MTLGDLIKFLESLPPEAVVPFGFGEGAHSYRGYYEDVAFTPKQNARICDMSAVAMSALGKTFQGWKGGDFEMNEYTDCWIAERGECGSAISETLCQMWKWAIEKEWEYTE